LALGQLTLDEVLELLDKTTKRAQKIFEDSKEIAQKQTSAYETILQMKDATEEQRLKAFMGRMIAYDRLDRLSAQLSLLYTLQIFAFKVKVLEVSVDKIDEQLQKSGILAKGNEIADIRKHIDALKILVEAQYESLKEIKDRSKDLPYIF
jgi:CRP-like cAMP-binding protein